MMGQGTQPRRDRVIVLAENSVGSRGLLAEHGLALWIEFADRRILFDTGQGFALGHNAAALGVDLSTAEAVVLSHGHYDHAGALGEVLQRTRDPHLYAHPAAFADKYARNPDGTSRDIGMPKRQELLPRVQASLVAVDSPAEVAEGVHATGPVPRVTEFEDTGGAFFLDRGCTTPDPLLDDQAVYLETDSGTVVLLGCGHAGMINTLWYVRSLTSGRPIRAVIGGMHLRTASEERIRRTIVELEGLGRPSLYPCHCTGFTASARFWQTFPDRCTPCIVGTVIGLDDGDPAARKTRPAAGRLPGTPGQTGTPGR
jgi:7,8-dihydropterin-6-yl-methyl-4-(beta-D-ribofuranosyl)aminobenzene 5'-phosphate synthase